MKRSLLIIFLASFFFTDITVYGAEIYLKNGDRISGDIVEEDKNFIYMDSEAAGMVSINKGFVEDMAADEIEKAKERDRSEAVSTNEISVGYTLADGNTENQQLNAGFLINRHKRHVYELTVKGDLYYSSSNGETDAEKWFGYARYAYSFGPSKMWYNFFKIEADRDKFSDIEYRLIPSAGIGYWFSDADDFKLMAEVAAGIEHTDYAGETETEDELAIIPRAYYETAIFRNSRLGQDVTFYPSVEEWGEFRMHAETSLINPLSDKLSVNFSFIDDYDSDPGGDAEKNDIRFISSLKYSF
ncbi:MAG: DUF481 domain-containing protein [Candidatus Omnitrophica bacterium]|nr:DUF481 domain-containing protein [Candidatus Omnitrophota bacterium]